jgi:hypothetical protein
MLCIYTQFCRSACITLQYRCHRNLFRRVYAGYNVVMHRLFAVSAETWRCLCVLYTRYGRRRLRTYDATSTERCLYTLYYNHIHVYLSVYIIGCVNLNANKKTVSYLPLSKRQFSSLLQYNQHVCIPVLNITLTPSYPMSLNQQKYSAVYLACTKYI